MIATDRSPDPTPPSPRRSAPPDPDPRRLLAGQARERRRVLAELDGLLRSNPFLRGG